MGAGTLSMEHIHLIKQALPVMLLAFFWCWETWRPFFGQSMFFGQPYSRSKHGVRNVAIAVFNSLSLSLVFGSLTAAISGWTAEKQVGLLYVLPVPDLLKPVVAFILLDAWMYIWHRANHMVPLLWRFHRMHHSDRTMDITTATRFHFGEQTISAGLRCALIPLLGIQIWHLVIYDAMVLCVITFHHSDISVGRWDRWLRLAIVTPDMHKVHHSDLHHETNSNYSTILSFWDRIAATFRIRSDPQNIVFGLREYGDPAWQSWTGMWKTPFVDPEAADEVRDS